MAVAFCGLHGNGQETHIQSVVKDHLGKKPTTEENSTETKSDSQTQNEEFFQPAESHPNPSTDRTAQVDTIRTSGRNPPRADAAIARISRGLCALREIRELPV